MFIFYIFNTDNSSRAVMWLKSETDFMLQRYRKYIEMVSSQVNCSIKTKKQMWQRIANEMKRELNVERTGEQIQNRYKTLMVTDFSLELVIF